jgi:hypothetical protein
MGENGTRGVPDPRPTPLGADPSGVLHGDGGGKAPAILRPLQGRTRVAVALINWARSFARLGGVTFRRAEVNVQSGAIVLDPQRRLIGVVTIEVAEGQVQAINSLINPDKLRHLGLPAADLAALLRAPTP